jgi:hypothetical protein
MKYPFFGIRVLVQIDRLKLSLPSGKSPKCLVVAIIIIVASLRFIKVNVDATYFADESAGASAAN